MEKLFSVFNKLPRGKIIQLIRCQLCPNQGEQFFYLILFLNLRCRENLKKTILVAISLRVFFFLTTAGYKFIIRYSLLNFTLFAFSQFLHALLQFLHPVREHLKFSSSFPSKHRFYLFHQSNQQQANQKCRYSSGRHFRWVNEGKNAAYSLLSFALTEKLIRLKNTLFTNFITIPLTL